MYFPGAILIFEMHVNYSHLLHNRPRGLCTVINKVQILRRSNEPSFSINQQNWSSARDCEIAYFVDWILCLRTFGTLPLYLSQPWTYPSRFRNFFSLFPGWSSFAPGRKGHTNL